MVQKSEDIRLDWVYPLKKRILITIFGFLTLSITLTMAVLAYMLRDSMDQSDAIKTRELSLAIQSSLNNFMLTRNPDMIQTIMENIGSQNNTIEKAFIINNKGKIIYSSDRADIGREIDRFSDPACHSCHVHNDMAPGYTNITIEKDGEKLSRNVRVIHNEPRCYGCHSPSGKVNGKLIIDNSREEMHSLIRKVELVIFGSGILCLILLIPLTSRVISSGLNKYIDEIVSQNLELKLLYIMMERLSKTIDFDELKTIVFEVLRDMIDPDEIDMVFHKRFKLSSREYSMFSWSREKGDIMRRKIEDTWDLTETVRAWSSGKFPENSVSPDRNLVYLPIRKTGADLALIIARKNTPFEESRLRLLKLIGDHISVAFENALLYHIAITDELTSLYTQRHFRTTMDRKFTEFDQYGEKFSLLILDLDDFKKVNDTYGHLAGDSVLVGLSAIFLQSIRENDVAFRYGGEEFAIILPSTGRKGAMHVAERIRESVESHVFEEGTDNIRLTISIGVAVCPDHARSARDLMLTADQALYKAKNSGKNQVVLSDAEPDKLTPATPGRP